MLTHKNEHATYRVLARNRDIGILPISLKGLFDYSYFLKHMICWRRNWCSASRFLSLHFSKSINFAKSSNSPVVLGAKALARGQIGSKAPIYVFGDTICKCCSIDGCTHNSCIHETPHVNNVCFSFLL